MKKVAVFLVIVLIMSMPMSAIAATRSLSVNPDLTFSGTTAKCTTTVLGNDMSEYLVVTMKLMYGTSCVASWNGSGYGYVYMDKTANAVKGRTYELVVEVTVNGVAKEPISTTKTC